MLQRGPSTLTEGFAFEDEDLEAMQAFEKMQLQRSTDANVASNEAGAGEQRSGTVHNDENNTKPKEQND